MRFVLFSLLLTEYSFREQLEELGRSTPPPTDSFDDPLDRALNEISSLATNMNEGKRDAESRRKLVQWQARIRGKFPSPLVQPHRWVNQPRSLHCIQFIRKFNIEPESQSLAAWSWTAKCSLPESSASRRCPSRSSTLTVILRVLPSIVSHPSLHHGHYMASCVMTSLYYAVIRRMAKTRIHLWTYGRYYGCKRCLNLRALFTAIVSSLALRCLRKSITNVTLRRSALRIVDTKAILYLEAPSTSEALTWFRGAFFFILSRLGSILTAFQQSICMSLPHHHLHDQWPYIPSPFPVFYVSLCSSHQHSRMHLSWSLLSVHIHIWFFTCIAFNSNTAAGFGQETIWWHCFPAFLPHPSLSLCYWRSSNILLLLLAVLSFTYTLASHYHKYHRKQFFR